MELERHLDAGIEDQGMRSFDKVAVGRDLFGLFDDFPVRRSRHENNGNFRKRKDLPRGLGSVHPCSQIDVHKDEVDFGGSPAALFDRRKTIAGNQGPVVQLAQDRGLSQSERRVVFDNQYGLRHGNPHLVML